MEKPAFTYEYRTLQPSTLSSSPPTAAPKQKIALTYVVISGSLMWATITTVISDSHMQRERGGGRVVKTGYGTLEGGPELAFRDDNNRLGLATTRQDRTGRDATRTKQAMEAAASSSSASDDDHGGIIQASEPRRGMSVAGRGFDERRNPRAMANDGYQQHAQYRAPQPPRRWGARVAQKVKQWVFVYNVTTGLYMLDWWERCIFNAVFVVLFAVVGYNSGHYLQRMGASLLAWAWAWRSNSSVEIAGAGAGAPGE